MQRRRPIAMLVTTWTICAAAACTAEPPAECLAFVSCFAAEGNPYEQAGVDPPYVQAAKDGRLGDSEKVVPAQVNDELMQAYGPDGNCWLMSPEGRLWVSCHLTCAQAIKSHCELPNEPETGAFCREDPGTATQRFGAAESEPMISCEEVSKTVADLEVQLRTLDKAGSQSQ